MVTQNKKTILIATGLYPPDVGGPSYYAKNLKESFDSLGFKTKICVYGLEKKIPIGLRHFYYFFRVLLMMPGVDYLVALDTFSVGLPVVSVAKILKKRVIIRTGGDFLWETYVNRTKEFITLSSFYAQAKAFRLKEKLIFNLTKWTLKNSWRIVFSTDWQRQIWRVAYGLDLAQTTIIENSFEIKTGAIVNKNDGAKKFLWAGREIFLKNLNLLKTSFMQAQKQKSDLKLELVSGLPQAALFDKIKEVDALVVPSLSEISPNLILEGLSWGKPFILTKENGLAQRFVPCGLLIDPLSESDLTAAILRLAQPEVYETCCLAISNLNFTQTYLDIGREFINLLKQE